MTVTNGYATLADVKAALRITDSVDDNLIEIAIESASREIDGYCERVFYDMGEQTRTFLPTDTFLVDIDDLQSVTSLKTDSNGNGTFDVTWSASDYQLEPLNQFASGLEQPYTRIRAIGRYLFPVFDVKNSNYYEASIQIVGTWGFSAIPTAVKQACILSSMRQFKRYDAPLGIAGFGDFGPMRVSRIDPDIEQMLSPWRRVRMA
jgi:hypothetical protein